MRDFLEIMKTLDIYDVARHNKSEHIYTFGNGSIVEFFSVDDEQKIRGRKRDLAWCNEANELYYDDFTQLNMRTEGKLIFDYNPSESNSWLYELPVEE
jgi:phage terminase large subunit